MAEFGLSMTFTHFEILGVDVASKTGLATWLLTFQPDGLVRV